MIQKCHDRRNYEDPDVGADSESIKDQDVFLLLGLYGLSRICSRSGISLLRLRSGFARFLCPFCSMFHTSPQKMDC